MNPDKSTLDNLRIERPSPEKRAVKRWPLFAGAATFLVTLAVVIWWVSHPGTVTVKTVLAKSIQAGTPNTLLNASGYVTARRQATVSSKVTGKVMEVLVEEGMRVEAGQVLARLDSSNVEASMLLAQAQLESARNAVEETRANLELSEREYKRTSALSEKAVVSSSDLDRAEADVKTFRARLARQEKDIIVAERGLTVWKQQLDDMTIRAPFDGIITSKNAQPGEMISPMSSGGFTRTGICTMVDMNSLEIEVDVNENYISRVEPGQPVEAVLDSSPDWHIPAKVIAIIPTADRQKATVKVRIGFGKLDPRILPDMGVKVAFQSAGAVQSTGPSFVIPKAALRQQEGRDIVWVAHDGHVERRAVKIALTGDETATIQAGLNEGERVVVEGPGDLVEGTQVTEAKP
jgi:RND family efflux transporter MFP subunit